jgi:hypothetical protein
MFIWETYKEIRNKIEEILNEKIYLKKNAPQYF